ncbi:hypothetical protein J7T55_006939 [Diaporthe amygdali]|uniref:uncharacterized protein n=1 Tax=Phomopsis amygdali TaxID=1214568 RepID=UPI0022FEF3EE|nr:uncharacterized protein J7T55_006939 [Diaporthe amygdali]KAJ0107061.1 hypothetical protein J7T55_006939 [Diaporthe amygdali]
MATLQRFDHFLELPRELQLRIWEFYQLAQPHHRHYFRSMIVLSGRLYAGADQYTNRPILNIATADDPNQTRVPNAAVAPWTKIELPTNNQDQHWASQDDFPAAATFSRIQTPKSMASPAHIYVNFRNDTFCFVNNSTDGNSNGGNRNFLQYLHGATSLFPFTPGPPSRNMSHWFSRIESIALINLSADRNLSFFDRQVLGTHPSLRRVTIVTVVGPFLCMHFDLPTERRPESSSAIERIPLKTFLVMRERVTRSCICDEPMKCLGGLEQLKQELVDLFRNRTNTFPRVDVAIEVEVYWTQRPGIDSLVAGTQSSLAHSLEPSALLESHDHVAGDQQASQGLPEI